MRFDINRIQSVTIDVFSDEYGLLSIESSQSVMIIKGFLHIELSNLWLLIVAKNHIFLSVFTVSNVMFLDMWSNGITV